MLDTNAAVGSLEMNENRFICVNNKTMFQRQLRAEGRIMIYVPQCLKIPSPRCMITRSLCPRAELDKLLAWFNVHWL